MGNYFNQDPKVKAAKIAASIVKRERKRKKRQENYLKQKVRAFT
jgi:hypothetical protein